jgi:hypothetical protein
MSVIARLKAAGVQTYSRTEWGSVRPAAYTARRSTHPMPAGPARYHFLHITVTPDTDTVLEGFNGARKVESYGLSTPPMVSYHGLTTNEGKWFEGQSFGVKGTHTINDKGIAGFPHDLNLYGYAQAIMQNVGDEVTATQARVLAMAFAAAELDGYVQRGAPIYPHRTFANKSCPGDKAVARLSEITRLKNQFVLTGLPTSKPTPAIPTEDPFMAISDTDASKIADFVWKKMMGPAGAQSTAEDAQVKGRLLTEKFAADGEVTNTLKRIETNTDS